MLRLRIFLFLGLTAIVLSAPTTTESFVEETTEELIFEAQTDAYYDDSTVSPITSKAPVKPKVTKKPATRSSVPNYTSSHKFGSKVINKLAKTTTESPANDASSTLPPKFYENFIKKMVEGLFDEKQTFSGLLNNGVKKLNENYKVCQDFVSMLKRAVGALEQAEKEIEDETWAAKTGILIKAYKIISPIIGQCLKGPVTIPEGVAEQLDYLQEILGME